jgi:hypothetical protein
MATVEIPLFPLRTVLFPGQPLPLRIFEPRYKQMTRELLESGGSFGVVLIREGQEVGGSAVPYNFGTTAVITECEEVQNGRFALTATGVQRFRLVEWMKPRPYPYGLVELIDDATVERGAPLDRALETVRATFPVYFKLALSLTDQWARALRLPAEPHALVNFLGQWLQTDEEVKQRLLEIVPAAERVGYLAEVVDELVARTREEVTEYRRRKFEGLGSGN